MKARGPHQAPLSEWLLDELATSRDRSQFARRLVLAPSAAAAAAQRRAIADTGKALLGVDFVSPIGLCRSVLQIGGIGVSSRAVDPLQQRQALRAALPTTRIGKMAQRFPAALRQLLSQFREFERLLPRPFEERLATLSPELHAIWLSYRANLAGTPGRFELMQRAADALTRGQIRDSNLPAEVLVTDRSLTDHRLLPEADTLALLSALNDRGVRVAYWPGSEVVARIELHNCPDPAAELRRAASACLDAAAKGLPFSSMVVAVTRFDPYLPHIAHEFGREGVPFHTPFEQRLDAHPLGALSLDAAQILFSDCPRDPLLRFLASPHLRQPLGTAKRSQLLSIGRRPELQGLGGYSQRLIERLPELGERLDVATRVGSPRTAVELAQTLLDFMTSTVAVESIAEDAVRARWQAAIMALTHLAPDGVMSCESFVAELGDVLRKRTTPLRQSVPGGVHIVEWSDALCIPHLHVQVLGLAEDLPPRPAPMTAFLSGSERTELGLADADAHIASQRAQLELLCTGVELVTASRPRQQAILPRPPSRLVEHLVASEIRHPAHPIDICQARIEAHRCPDDLALRHCLLHRAESDTLAWIAGEAAVTTMQQARDLQRFRGNLERDGQIDSDIVQRLTAHPLSVSSFESFGQCPQRFLFSRLLRRTLLPRLESILEVPQNELGSILHRCLEGAYSEALPRFERGVKPSDLGADLSAALARHFDSGFRFAGLQESMPGLFRILAARWLGAAQRVVELDLIRLEQTAQRPVAVEEEIEATLEIGSSRSGVDRRIRLQGRIDRIDRSVKGCYVTDFKTGRSNARFLSQTAMLRGQSLQLPVYSMMLEARDRERPIEMRTVSVRAGFDEPTSEIVEKLETAVVLDPDHRSSIHAGFIETLAVLLDLLATGAFIANKGDHCRHCPFHLGCRRNHAPSVSRVRNIRSGAISDFFGLAFKQHRAPRLRPPPTAGGNA